MCIASVSPFWLKFHSGLAEEKKTQTNLLEYTKRILLFLLKLLPSSIPTSKPQGPSYARPQLPFPDAGARPCKPQETFISIKRHLGLKDVLCGRDVILCSIPGSPCRGPTARSPPPCELQSEQRRSRGPRARLRWRLRASSGHDLPVTVAVPLSVCLEQQQYN